MLGLGVDRSGPAVPKGMTPWSWPTREKRRDPPVAVLGFAAVVKRKVQAWWAGKKDETSSGKTGYHSSA